MGDRLATREPAERAFSEALAHGCLSAREVSSAARGAGALPLTTTKGKGWPTWFFRSETALNDVVEAKEFHRRVALSHEGPRAAGVAWFRWEGHLARYATLREEENALRVPVRVALRMRVNIVKPNSLCVASNISNPGRKRRRWVDLKLVVYVYL